ncbi:helix-turn-helix transcriptional regulator [Arenibacter sp. 6A1]|uniref:AraC family transcriptional regulator n=1 Tax=Arenibacter sp. 6A1 TaxID=2720391 RepID=UPI001447C1AA|nr:AraC family transcriptional regulator [Arenibacter sp. 6A1]NKI27564.1 helix-turn-helix transcriptional regulator [Arenibacter sp. 6A1]
MKANFHKLNYPIEQAFHIRKDVREYFDDHWHFHDMIELVYIQHGQGGRYIGDSIDAFSDGEVVLVGAHLPHVWKSNFFEDQLPLQKKCVSIVIQFPEDFLGINFMSLPEAKHIKFLFKRAERGIVFMDNDRKVLAKKITSLLKLEGMERLIKFIDILNYAAKSINYQLLASPLFVDTITDSDNKINKVFEYIMDNFTEDIQLTTAASLIGMNKTSFCRYFKKRTKKTFSSFLNEVRIGHACKLISQDRIPITESAYLSGYNSPSYFYKQFKEITGVSPTEYQAKLI